MNLIVSLIRPKKIFEKSYHKLISKLVQTHELLWNMFQCEGMLSINEEICDNLIFKLIYL
jgi:hypothetical protein